MTPMADSRALALLLSNQIHTLVLLLLRNMLERLGHSFGPNGHRYRRDEDAAFVRIFAVAGCEMCVDGVEDTLDFGFLSGFLLVDDAAGDLEEGKRC